MFDKLIIRAKKLHPEAIIPKYANPGDAGLDFFSVEDIIVPPKSRVGVHTGISLELPEGFVSLFWDKSGLALREGLTVLGGVIDSGYRGEYIIILYNTNDKPYEIKKGHKVAQLLIQRVENASIQEVTELTESIRGEGNFGSSGK